MILRPPNFVSVPELVHATRSELSPFPIAQCLNNEAVVAAVCRIRDATRMIAFKPNCEALEIWPRPATIHVSEHSVFLSGGEESPAATLTIRHKSHYLDLEMGTIVWVFLNDDGAICLDRAFRLLEERALPRRLEQAIEKMHPIVGYTLLIEVSKEFTNERNVLAGCKNSARPLKKCGRPKHSSRAWFDSNWNKLKSISVKDAAREMEKHGITPPSLYTIKKWRKQNLM